MIPAVTRLLAQESEKGVDLPADPIVIGVGVFSVLVLLLLVTLSFGKDR